MHEDHEAGQHFSPVEIWSLSMDFFKLQSETPRKMSEAGPDLKALIASHKQQVGELNGIWKSAIFNLKLTD